MRITIERLRKWVLVLSGILVAVILGVFGYTRYRLSHIGRDLPARLGVNIQQDANGFTFSKSQAGHTLFTLHASRLIQYKGGGHATLRDVSITLYGSDNSRSDHVYGKEFDYDQQSQTARAVGMVQIDVQAPSNARGTTPADRTVHVQTSGLTFSQKSGEASTDEPVTFAVADAKGTATGASYDSAAGVLVLKRAVQFTAMLDKGPLTLTADHAEFNRLANQLAMLKDDLRYAGDHSNSEQAVVRFREDGTVARIDASGHVNIMDAKGRQMHSSTAEVLMDSHGTAQQATMDGGLLFSANEGPHSLHGNANSGLLQLGPDESLKRVDMHSAVTVVDQEIGPANDPNGSITREVKGSTVSILFTPSAGGSAEAERLIAAGGAVLTEHTIYSNTAPQNTVMKGDRIEATLRNGRALDRLHAEGDTSLTNTNPSGVSQTSTGDTLDITFAQESTAHAAGKPDAMPPSLVERAVQRGRVFIVQAKPAKDEKTLPWRSQATADVATLDGPRQIIHLEGSPRLSDQDAEMTADSIDFYRLSGAVTADHDVKVSLRQGASAQAPAHASAAKVFFDHERDEAILSGGAQDAHLWQGANSISAPVILVDRHNQVLTAHGSGTDGQPAAGRVHGVFADPGSNSTGTDAIVRVEAATLTYSAAERKATLQGNVVALQSGGRLHARTAQLFMTGDRPGTTPTSRVPNPRGSLDRMIADGGIELDQQGRKGTGERLVYTASDGRFVLSGRTGDPARMTDAQRGTVTGSSLIFTNRGGSVEVDGGTGRAVTETQVLK